MVTAGSRPWSAAAPGPAPRAAGGVCSGLRFSGRIWSETVRGPVRRRPGSCGLGRGLLDRADDVSAARERSESLLRCSPVIAHTRPRHAPPPGPERARIVWPKQRDTSLAI